MPSSANAGAAGAGFGPNVRWHGAQGPGWRRFWGRLKAQVGLRIWGFGQQKLGFLKLNHPF